MAVRRGAATRAAMVTALVLALDQATKAIVRASIPLGERDRVLPGVDLVHARNDGVAFNVLAGGSPLVVVVIAIAVGALVAYFATHLDKPLIWLPTGMLLGGAVGNIVDRVRDGAVTDFVKLPAWPAFNVADMSITFGVLVLLYVIERPRDGAAGDG
jgi:signal peptidase II